MRLRQLDLTRYGKFSDRTLDFGATVPGKADFHIVYGPNEAGKSTTLSAYMDLLFGIAAQSSFNFLHDYKSMQVGGVLEVDGEALALTRTKGNKDTLRDARGQVVDPARLSAVLRGLDRDAYGAMFSLDGARLESGGEDILASKGELGRMLFSAASGMADIGGTLSALSGQAAAFFAPKKRKHELNELKDQLKALDDERKTLDTQAGEFDRLRDALAAALTRRDATVAERSRLLLAKDRLDRLSRAFPVAQDLTELREKERGLSDYPPLDDPSLQTEIETLRTERTEARTLARTAVEAIARVDAELGDLKRDPDALGFADRLAEIELLRARYRTGRDDLEKRRLEKAEAEQTLQVTLAALGAPDGKSADVLAQPVDRIAAFGELISEEKRLTDRRDRAANEKIQAEQTLETASRVEAETGGGTVDVDTFAPMITRIRGDDPVRALSRAEAALTRAVADAERMVADLSPWSGDVDALLASRVPSAEQAAHWRDIARKIADDRAALQTRKAKDADDLARQNAAIASMTGGEGVVSDAQASETRAQRDAAWRKHRSALSDETADDFERALGDDDRAQTARLAQSDRLASLRELEQSRAASEAGLAAAEEEETRLDGLDAALLAGMAGPLRDAGLPGSFDPLGLPAWLAKWDTALLAANAAISARRDHDAAKRLEEAHRLALRDALAECETPLKDDWSLDRLLDLGDALIERAKAAALAGQSRAKALKESTERAEKRRTDLADAEADLNGWRARWSDALTGTWLEGRGTAQVSALIDPLRALPAQMKDRDFAVSRVENLERDIRAFERALDDLAADADGDSEKDADTRFTRLADRISAARLAEEKVATLQAARKASERDKSDAETQLASVAERVMEIAARYSASLEIDDVDKLALALGQSMVRAELQEKIASAERALTGLLECALLDEAAAMLADTDASAVTARRIESDSALEQAETDWKDAIVAHRDAESAIESVGGDGAVARLEETRATLLLDIGDKAEACLRLTLGVMAAERALHLYRDRHRSAMMSRTADAFREITGGTYARLETKPEGDAERLIAIRGDTQASVGVDGMSTATRHQLFFALRIAGYEDFCAKAGPLPLIADDILESFDEDRAAEAFGQLRTLAGLGQAIYLTHHRHLCTIAEKICGDDVTIHAL